MKRLYLIIYSVLCTLATSAQTIGEAFYIYRNDGQFNAFFREEVDSMAYSCYDADSLLYEDIVSQIIYTQDSTYVIPLAAIDSVSFVQPEIKLQPEVIQMEKGLLDYLQSVNNMTLFFHTDIPALLKPMSGAVLVCTSFDHPLFEEGFVGKVQRTSMTEDAFVVECDTVYDITEIFEQLISIEKIYDENAAEVKPLFAPQSWTSSRVPVTLSLNYDGPKFKLSGALEGSYIATITWNITQGEDHFMDVRINHDWHYSAHLNIHDEQPFFKKGNTWVGPTVRFPAQLPIFKFQLLGSPFVRGEGKSELDVSLNGPKHSYLLSGSIRNGQFSGWHNIPVGQPVNNAPSFDASLSLNGFVQGGYMVEFYLGTIKCLGYAKAAIDCYFGPKLKGDFTMKAGSEDDFSYYNTYKNSKLSLDVLALDIEAYGEAAYLKQKPRRHKFFTLSLPSMLQHSWYLMPEFSELNVDKDENKLSATIECTPKRDILFPLRLGLGIYDDNGSLIDSKFESNDYKRENEGFKLNQTFISLKNNTNYIARPMVRIFGGEIPASPTEEFKIEKCPVTLSDFKVTKSQYKKDGFTNDGMTYDYRFDVSVTATLEEDAENISDWGYVYEDPNGRIKEISLRSHGKTYTDKNYAYFRNEPHATCCLYGYVYYEGIEDPVYGTPEDFPLDYESESLCPDSNHPHMIDLGIGVKWACCNVGAHEPEGYGGYYAWGEVAEKNYYSEENYQYYNSSTYSCVHIGDNISGTQYDAARVNWGAPWRMPTYYGELVALYGLCTSEWTTINGVNGRKFTGPNGNSIFLPAAGKRWHDELDRRGSWGFYWSGTLDHQDFEWHVSSLDFDDGDFWYGGWRSDGHSVRPVSE